MGNEAQLTGIKPLGNALRRCAEGITVDPPYLVSANAAAVQVFDKSELQGRKLNSLVIQNTGTQAIKYSINQSDCSAVLYHGVIAGGSGAGDGLGGVLSFDLTPQKVHLFAAGAYTAAVIKSFE